MEHQQPHKRQRAQLQPPQQQQQQREQRPGAASDTTSSDGPPRIWLPEVVQHFASFLTDNELAATLRLTNKATAAQFREPQHATVQLSLPVPHHAFAWRWGGPDATRSLTVLQREELPCLTARSGSISNLEVLLARDDRSSPLKAEVLAAAAGAGQLEVCRWLRQQGCPMDDPFKIWHAEAVAAGGGHRAVCEWLLDEGDRPADVWVAAAASARSGHVDLMDWLLERTAGAHKSNVPDLLAAAAAGCDLLTLQRLHHTYLDTQLAGFQQGKVLFEAAGSPTVDWRDKVEWLEGRGCPRTAWVCMEAAQRVDSRERLEWLQQRGYPLTSDLLREAAAHGNVDALEFLLAQGVELGEVDDDPPYDAPHYAASGGHLAALKVLHAHGAPLDDGTVAAAAGGGHLPVVAWLVETLGAAEALAADVFANAAMSGNAELLAWLHEHGCPWDASVFTNAARWGSEEQLEWLAERGCPMESDAEPYRWAVENADLAMLRCLRRLGCPWGPAGRTFGFAIEACTSQRSGFAPRPRKQRLLVLTWLVDQGCPVYWGKAERKAEKGGDSEVLAWLQPDAIPDAADPYRIWLPEVVHHFARFLGGNELAATLRLVNKATAAQFRGPQHTTVRLSLPVPHHAFVWRWGGLNATRSLTVRQRQQLPCLSARSGSITNLEVLLPRDDLTSPLAAAVLAAAAGAGQLEVCHWLRQQGCPLDDIFTMWKAAAGGGHQAVCEWLLDEDDRPADVWAASVAAARGGHVDLMDWLLERTAGIQGSNVWIPLAAAAAGCGLLALQRLHHTYMDSQGRQLPDYEQDPVVVAAAGSPTADWRDKVEWLEGQGCPRTDSVCVQAAQRVDGRARLEWLQRRGYPLTSGVAIEAAAHGNADALEFLLAQGVELMDEGLDLVATSQAAEGGHLAALKVLHTHGAPVDDGMVRAAALGGHLPVVAWLAETLGATVALTAGVFASAAESGNAELLAWLHERGCPWDAPVFAAAARGGSEEQLEWMAEHGCPMGDDGAPYRWVLPNDLAMLRCLLRLGCPGGPNA
ncbi:Ankyrin repeat domain-containing protein, partial [Tetrabaena socialis]